MRFPFTRGADFASARNRDAAACPKEAGGAQIRLTKS
jgi:hypothetical protein